ncbi:hypothetical protein B0H14DRAFT_2570123 [Mycena olivaceomarginata]|nr:hypothetical protein B0H14DRAFT_2570123 [Mycena olivaceomarginata]
MPTSMVRLQLPHGRPEVPQRGLTGQGGGLEARTGIFDTENFAWVQKGEIAKWAFKTLKANGFTILSGYMIGTAKDTHGYNWTLSNDLQSIVFFDPTSGVFSNDIGYTALRWGFFF